jgi:hypothetical protein
VWKNATYVPAVVSHGKTLSANVKIRYALIVALDLLKQLNTELNAACLGRVHSRFAMSRFYMENCSYRVRVSVRTQIA